MRIDDDGTIIRDGRQPGSTPTTRRSKLWLLTLVCVGVLAVMVGIIISAVNFANSLRPNIYNTPGAEVNNFSYDAPETPAPEPLSTAPENRQILDVAVTGTDAYIRLLDWSYEKGWDVPFQTNGYVGENGLSNNRKQGDKTTPEGIFEVKFVFGLTQPETNLAFRPVTKTTVWVTDTKSAYYNTWQDTSITNKNWNGYENLYKLFTTEFYVHNIAIGYNGDCVTANSAIPNKGSAIFICGRNSPRNPTTADVDVYESDMLELLKHLDATKNPVVEIHYDGTPLASLR
jgi:L,D-peptidoglycan transpeptidase YkuD (ErfK/YbiS/YcfS/YnhG family)